MRSLMPIKSGIIQSVTTMRDACLGKGLFDELAVER
jgi:hypothetical protein